MRHVAFALLMMSAPAVAKEAEAPGPLARADHVAIHVSDAEVSAAFYRQAFRMTDLPTKLPNGRWLDMGNGLTLHIIGGRSTAPPSDRFVHLALRTEDLAVSTAWFDANGIAWCDFTGKPRSIQTRFDGVRQIFVQDPDGYWVEVSDARGTPHD